MIRRRYMELTVDIIKQWGQQKLITPYLSRATQYWHTGAVMSWGAYCVRGPTTERHDTSDTAVATVYPFATPKLLCRLHSIL